MTETRSRKLLLNPLRWYIPLGPWRIYPQDLVLVIVAAWVIRWLTVYDWKSGGNDVQEYIDYARHFWFFRPVHHALPLEYPPLALAVFSLTLFPATMNGTEAFTLWMAVAVILGYLLMQIASTRRKALTFAGYLLLGLAPVVMARFDLIPMLATLGAFYATRERRYWLAYVLLAIGILLKVYPVFLVPIVMIVQFRARSADSAGGQSIADDGQLARQSDPARRAVLSPAAPNRFALARLWLIGRPILLGGLVVGGIVALGFLAARRVDPAHVLTFLTYATQRPTQFESTWSIVVFLARGLGQPATYLWAFGSNNWGGDLSYQLAGYATPALVIGAVLVYAIAIWRRMPLARAFLAILGIVILTNKVFSPQYLIWIVPFAVEADGEDVAWVVILGTTLFGMVFYPFSHRFYDETMVTHFMWLVMLRNAIFLFVVVRALVGFTLDIDTPLATVPAPPPDPAIEEQPTTRLPATLPRAIRASPTYGPLDETQPSLRVTPHP